MRELLGVHARAAVAAGDAHGAAVRTFEKHAELGFRRRVAQAVALDVFQRALQGVGVELQHAFGADAVVPADGDAGLLRLEGDVFDGGADHLIEYCGHGREARSAFVAGIGEEAFDEAVDGKHLQTDAVHHLAAAGGIALGDFERNVDAGKRTAQFVTHVMKEPALAGDETADLAGHAVEHPGERLHLRVGTADAVFDAGVEPPGGKAAHGRVELSQGARVVVGERRGHDGRQDKQCERRHGCGHLPVEGVQEKDLVGRVPEGRKGRVGPVVNANVNDGIEREVLEDDVLRVDEGGVAERVERLDRGLAAADLPSLAVHDVDGRALVGGTLEPFDQFVPAAVAGDGDGRLHGLSAADAHVEAAEGDLLALNDPERRRGERPGENDDEEQAAEEAPEDAVEAAVFGWAEKLEGHERTVRNGGRTVSIIYRLRADGVPESAL